MEKLISWCQKNKLQIQEVEVNNITLISTEIGVMYYLQPYNGKIIDEDFSFIIDEDFYDMVQEKQFQWILFEFGGGFYYSGIHPDKNKYGEYIYKPDFLDFKYIGHDIVPNFDFVHFGVHSEYELMNGSGNAEVWATKAKFLNHSVLGICDKNTLAGTLSFQTACEKKGLKSIIGETISVAINYKGEANPELFEMKLYCLNSEGWDNLLYINSLINVINGGFIPDYDLLQYGKGIAAVIPRNSEFNQFKHEKSKIIKLITKYKKAFDKLYYQIDTVEFNSDTLFKKHLENIDVYLSEYHRLIKPILINDSYYLDADQSELKSYLNKIDGKVHPESKTQYFKDVNETIMAYEEWFEDVPMLQDCIIEAIDNTVELANLCNFKIDTGNRKLPKFDCSDVESKFFEELENGIQERLGHLKPKELKTYLERVDTECRVMVPNGLCDYFMILWDVLKYCRENDINYGTGRGSVCGSLVAYLLYITDVDPLKYDLLFERFLNETRVKPEKFLQLKLNDKIYLELKIDSEVILNNGKIIKANETESFVGIDINIDKMSYAVRNYL